MKFVVIQDWNNEVEVKLHWETKKKIRQNLFRGAVVIVSAVSIWSIVNDRLISNEKTEDAA